MLRVMDLPSCARRLRDYVAIPSVNPMGRDDQPPEILGELRYAERVREDLRRLGVDAELVGDPARPSVLAVVRAAGANETVMVASHLDTVPVDGMEIDPFDPVVRDGRLFGRGACDTKAGMAALVAALERVLADGGPRRSLLLVGEADEEQGSRGAHEVVRHLGDAGAPDWVIATEPTDLRVVHRHKGVSRFRVEARGRAVHSSDPSAGRSAIAAIARAVLGLEELGRKLGERADPALGPPTISVGVVGGGQAANIVPDFAWLMADRRLVPGEDGARVRQELERALAAADEAAELVDFEVRKPPLATPVGHPAVRCGLALQGACGLPTEPACVAFGTDAGVFGDGGWPGIVFGPGSIRDAHTSRESVDLGQVETAQRWFEALLRGEGPRSS